MCIFTMKLFIVFFTFLAVQGWTSAISISEDADIVPDDVFKVMESSGFSVLEFLRLPQVNFNEFTGTAANPEKCLPYIQDAYNIAVEVRGVVVKAHEVGQRLMVQANKCLALTSPIQKLICFSKLKKQFGTESKPLNKAFSEISPKAIAIMDKFDKCMDSKTEDVNSKLNPGPEQCLPYVQEAYDTAVEVRRIVGQVSELANKLVVGLKKCKAETCLRQLLNQALEERKPIKDAYLKILPKINEVMGNFERCLV